MREIVKAKPIPTIKGWLLCEFDNHEKRFVDIRPSMKGVLSNLKDPTIFRKVFVDDEAGTVAWPSGLHIDPDTLYQRSIPVNEIQNHAEVIKLDDYGDWLERA
ncbi:DUF2442 domain-containing protein [Aquibacillus sediminis]|uniref:DUF2442 domain-containing protein n=1 Tax=Aquibacillus sediminis TaxID=2574734 RepID=UPI0011089535|nr:DUF2442 domain-containing protein [Aquibacillus sediminis]